MKPVGRGRTIVISEGQEFALCPHSACVAGHCRAGVPLSYQCDAKPIRERSHNGAHGYIVAVVYNDYLKTITGIVQAREGLKTRTKLTWAVISGNDNREKWPLPFHLLSLELYCMNHFHEDHEIFGTPIRANSAGTSQNVRAPWAEYL